MLARLIVLMYYGALSIWTETWLTVSLEVTKIMAKEQTDRTTLDLFTHERRPGRPKTNPPSCDEQLRINRRNQLKHDRVRGPKHAESELDVEVVKVLNELTGSRNIGRSELIEEMLMQQLAVLHSQGIV